MLTELQRRAARDVLYEMRRLQECYDRWSQLRVRGGKQIEVNDLIELILVHTRNVVDFFEFSRVHKRFRKAHAQKDDIVSEDYDWPAREVLADKKIKGRIDKEIAHLTYARCRLTTEQKKWNFDAFVPRLLDHCGEFVIYVADHYSKEELGGS